MERVSLVPGTDTPREGRRGRVLIGTCSWTDRSLIESGRFYPSWARTAEARLQFYASQFPIVEVDSTYYALPSPQTSALWVQRTPPGFLFDIKSYSLFTLHPTRVEGFPRDLQEALPEAVRAKGRVYYRDVPEEVREEAWRRFIEALLPLESAGKLGAVLLQFPPWVGPGREALAHILLCRERLATFPLAVEFRNTAWLSSRWREETFRFLEENGLAFVCVDEPQGFPSSVPPVAEATAETALVRFHGRNRETWTKRTATSSERFDYYYTPEELGEWVPRVRSLQERAREVHLLFNTNRGDQGVVNARLMASLLGVPLPGEGGSR